MDRITCDLWHRGNASNGVSALMQPKRPRTSKGKKQHTAAGGKAPKKQQTPEGAKVPHMDQVGVGPGVFICGT